MTTTWAYVFEHPGTDPVADRTEIDRGPQRTLLVPVPDAAAAVDVVDDLLAEGATLIELCGGFGVPEVAAVTARVAGRAAVGHVTFSADALEAAVAYARAAAEA